ncbi:Tox-REase-5 domain-containing protein [Corallococcus interemptor]|uniref:Tox-REase-5 domain-containing protein n=1 Tax=Corallococcus interemptor TaxID=2316720 RepID=UPI003D015974
MRAVANSGVQVDAWEQLLLNAGLEARDERPVGEVLTPTQAARLLGVLLRKPVTRDTLPPRMVVGFLLREVLEGGAISREELLRRVERFSREQIAVLRPDGYLAWALNGRTQQKVAAVEWKDGAFQAHRFELGRFYSGQGGVFRAVDEQLQASDWRPMAAMKGMALGAEVSVPVLSLSAEGALALERVAVPAGRAATVLSGGPGAAIILQRANTASKGGAPSQGPGQWAPAKESMSTRARRYQEQITGHTADEAYWVGGTSTKAGGVKFDGFKDDVLLEAKGPGYAEFFEDNFDPKDWFEASGKYQDLADQADRQQRIVQGMGIRIEWHVAEKHAAAAMRKLLENNGFTEITVIHTPARSLVR